MARLPTPGGDNGNWGNVLNEFLSQSLKTDGTLKDNTVTSNNIAPNSITSAKIANDAVGASQIADGAITNALVADSTLAESKLDNAVQTKLNAVGGDMVLSSTQTVTGVKTFNTGMLQDKGSIVYDVKAFGATGDGTTDDTTAVQAAIDAAAAAGGGTILLPRGTFVISRILLKHAVSVSGVGPQASILKAKSGVSGTDFGIIEMTTGTISFISLSNFGIQGNGNAGQWGIYLYADKAATSTGGLWQSRFSHLNIFATDNGIWLRGGRTGSVEPHQFIDLDAITVLRTATGGGDCLRSTGQVNQITRRNCVWQSISAATTRTGRAMYFGRDPNEAANASARYP